jgi:hypothetical protein
MRAASNFILSAVCTIGISAVPANAHARNSTLFSFGPPPVSQQHLDGDHRANHRFVRRGEHRAAAPAVVPFYASDDAAVPPSLAPEAPPDAGLRSHVSPAQLPACRETLDGVTIFRGQPCRV